ncbi:MAG TPA: YIP1 family protein [Gaiellaceae bacterium]|nr:YIP1 family protein [Gaiellaceae bacterium]
MDAEVRASTPDRDWWLRVLAVFQAPRTVFAGLRDDSDEQATARQEPVMALVLLAGMGAILVTTATRSLLDDPEIDRLLVLVLVFLAGALYGVAAYWIGGCALYLGVRAAGGDETYRRARHLLAFAAAPIALSLLALWPLQIAIYGSDLFRSGGGDEGGGGVWVFRALEIGFFAWALVLIVYGIRVVHEWPLVRSLGALVLAALALVALGIVPSLL